MTHIDPSFFDSFANRGGAMPSALSPASELGQAGIQFDDLVSAIQLAAQIERTRIVEWLRTMTASQWNDLPSDPRMPIAYIIASAIERGAHVDRENITPETGEA